MPSTSDRSNTSNTPDASRARHTQDAAPTRASEPRGAVRIPWLVGNWLMGTTHREAVINPATAGATQSRLGDYTTDGRTVYISALAIIVGVLGAVITIILISLIGLITNLAYYHRLSFKLVSPALNTLGWWAALIPIIGGLIVGVMARFGSERIRGHGIPEAMETILVGGSRIEPRLVLLKPTSSAIAIGTGGPFGAEGPIILTGGALGSVIGQLFKLSAAERKTLLVAGAAAGMTGIFNAPIASVLLAVELLAFEFKPRSLVPVALATVTSTILRRLWIGSEPMFPLGHHPTLGADGILAAAGVGILAGLLSWLLTLGIYGAEDLYRKLPVHWMWWPALGGVVVGLVGLVFPRVLGVGYDTIGAELAGTLSIGILISILVFKSLVWIVALSSGTSGGILAPVLLIGGAMGGILSGVLPTHNTGLWSLIAMAATLAALTDAPLTGVIFAVETSGALDTLLPLLAACATAYLVVVLILKRSILTEKVARRGFHISREYSVDPLEVLSAREVMLTDVVTLSADLPLASLRQQPPGQQGKRQTRLYPVIDDQGEMVGVISRADLMQLNHADEDKNKNEKSGGKDGTNAAHGAQSDTRRVRDVMRTKVVVAYPDETLRSIAVRMISTGVWRVPVVSRANPRQVVGMLSQRELLRAREHLMEEERHRERIFRLRLLAPRILRPTATTEELTVASVPDHDLPGEELEELVDVTKVEGERAPQPADTGVASANGTGAGGKPGKTGKRPVATKEANSTVIQQTGAVMNGDSRPGPDDM